MLRVCEPRSRVSVYQTLPDSYHRIVMRVADGKLSPDVGRPESAIGRLVRCSPTWHACGETSPVRPAMTRCTRWWSKWPAAPAWSRNDLVLGARLRGYFRGDAGGNSRRWIAA